MRKACSVILTLSALIPGVAFAHPESGFIPDAIAEIEYAIVLDLNPRDTATRNKLAVVLLRKNKLKEAGKEFIKVLEISPSDFDAHDGMGLVRVKEGKLEEAVGWFKKAIALEGEDTMVYYHLGSVYEKLGDFIKSKRCYEQALEVSDTLIQKDSNAKDEARKRELILEALGNLKEKMAKR